MQFRTILAAALFSFSQLVLADSEEFGIMSLRSTSAAHLLFLKENGDKLEFGSGDSLTATITDEGKLKFTDGKYAVAQDDGTFKTGSESEGSTGFAISKSYFTFKGSEAFYAIPDGSSFAMSSKSADNAISIAVSARSKNGQAIAEYTPSDVSKSNAASSTVAVSQITDGQPQATASVSQQTENGAIKVLGGLNLGLIGAVAAFLL